MPQIQAQIKSWQKVKLGKIASVLGGFAFKSSWFNNQKIGYPTVKIQNIKDGLVDVEDAEYVDVTKIKRDINKFKLEKGDLLVAMTGATAGKVGILIQDKICYLNQRVGKFYSKDISMLDKEFLHYSILNPRNLNLLKKLADGSAQGNMSSSQIEDVLEISFPKNPADQKRIADVLSAFDDKIELNNKISQTLEQMAQAIFKEWLLKNQKSKIKSQKLRDFAEITMGQSPASQYYNERGEGLPFHQGVTNFGNRFPTHKIYCTQNNRIAEGGDILLSVRAPVGRINIANAKISLGRGLAGIREKKNRQSFLYYFLKHRFQKEDSLGGGSVFPAVTRKDLEEIPVVIPNEEVIDKFEQAVSLIDEKIETIMRENQKLATLRDLLLPKLMSGEIRV